MKQKLLLYIIFCLLGATLEQAYGMFWAMCGTTPWIYPDSPFHYTSLEGLPLWGFGGFICISVYKAISQQRARFLLSVIPMLMLALLWILLYTN